MTEPFIQRMWRNNNPRPDGLDILCKAGTLVLFNNSNVHAGTVRTTPRPRRTLGMSFYAELQARVGAALRDNENYTNTILAQGVGRFVSKYPDILRWVPIVVNKRKQEVARQALASAPKL